jgi:hypothetical protein
MLSRSPTVKKKKRDCDCCLVNPVFSIQLFIFFTERLATASPRHSLSPLVLMLKT